MRTREAVPGSLDWVPSGDLAHLRAQEKTPSSVMGTIQTPAG